MRREHCGYYFHQRRGGVVYYVGISGDWKSRRNKHVELSGFKKGWLELVVTELSKDYAEWWESCQEHRYGAPIRYGRNDKPDYTKWVPPHGARQHKPWRSCKKDCNFPCWADRPRKFQ